MSMSNRISSWSSVLFGLLAIFAASLIILPTSNGALGATVKYQLNITYGFWSPDCVEKAVYLINGQYPGPRLTAVEGDIMIVTVVNQMERDALTIHWHGVDMVGTPLADGAAGITQCPIGRLESYQYKFIAAKAGTYIYHSHVGLQRTHGLYGELVIKSKATAVLPFQYADERSIIVTDWYHKSATEHEAGLDFPFTDFSKFADHFIGQPQTVLVNGRGTYDCSIVPQPVLSTSGDALKCNSAEPMCQLAVITVTAGSTYRLRISSAASLASLSVVIEGHTMTVIAADGYSVEPFTTNNLDIFGGQNVDVLLDAFQEPSNYWISVTVIGQMVTTPPGTAILNYAGVTAGKPSTSVPTSPTALNVTAMSEQAAQYKALSKLKKGDAPKVPATSGRKLILLNNQVQVGNKIRWAINNISYVLPSTPLYHSIKTGAYLTKKLFDLYAPPDNPPLVYDYSKIQPYVTSKLGNPVYFVKNGQVVDIVIQNANILGPNLSDFHPWHFHGHHFWVIGQGFGTYDPATHPATFNLVNPPYRHTFIVLPYQWVAIRYIANNPGVWSFHCHISAHQHTGMEVIFAEGTRTQFPPLPSTYKKCGLLL